MLDQELYKVLGWTNVEDVGMLYKCFAFAGYAYVRFSRISKFESDFLEVSDRPFSSQIITTVKNCKVGPFDI